MYLLTMANPKKTLTATLPNGKTATRKTARTYTHVVYVEGVKVSKLQEIWDDRVASAKKSIATYEKVLARKAAGVAPEDCHPENIRHTHPQMTAWDKECTAKFINDGSYEKWLADSKEDLEKLLASGRPTANSECPGVIGWCGRPDLAESLANTERNRGYWYGIRIIPVNP